MNKEILKGILEEYGSVVGFFKKDSDQQYNMSDPLLEMASIGDITSQYSVWIRNNDGGNIPHFHILDTQTYGKNFNCAIFIEDNRYFTHGKAKDILSKKLRIQLMNFLQETDEDGISNWIFLIKNWNSNNSKRKVTNDIKKNMPDYTEIKPYK